MNRLLPQTLLTISAIAILQVNLVNYNVAIAATGLVPAPSLQEEPIEILTATSAVLEAAASRTSQTVATLRIVEALPQNWSDGCLGLAKSDELCAQVITPGWQVVVTDGRRNWTYRTDDTGDLIRLEKAP